MRRWIYCAGRTLYQRSEPDVRNEDLHKRAADLRMKKTREEFLLSKPTLKIRLVGRENATGKFVPTVS